MTDRRQSPMLYAVELVIAALAGALLGGLIFMVPLDYLLSPRYGSMAWFPDFMDVIDLMVRALAGGLSMVAVVHYRHNHHLPPVGHGTE